MQDLKVFVLGEGLVLAPFTVERLGTQRYGAQRNEASCLAGRPLTHACSLP